MQQAHLAYAVLGAVVLVLSLAAGPIKRRLWISEPVLATATGVLLGPIGFDVFEPAGWGGEARILEEVARLTLAISLMGAALRLPDRWIKRNVKSLLVVLLAGMPLMWLVSSACAWWILGLPALESLLLGAIVTPTDPVVAGSIVTGKLAEESVAEDVRHLISAESGANDGLGFLLLMLPVLLLHKSTTEAVVEWSTTVLLAEVLGSIAAGAAVGFGCGKLLDWLYAREDSDRGSLLAVTVALSLLLLGGTAAVHGDGILAVFAGGLAFNWVIRDEEGHAEAQHERIQETLTRFFDVPVFVLFGMVLPWNQWPALGWSSAAFVLALLLLRRVPVILLLHRWIEPVRSLRDGLFVGWFGPIAVAAMVYAAWARVKEGREHIWAVASLVILTSIVVHGVTATPFTRLYARRGGQ